MLRVLLRVLLAVLAVTVGIPVFVVRLGGFPGVPRSQPSPAPDWEVRVWLDREARLVRLPLKEYVKGVVAAEMPAAFHPEALKAQAVAARTYAVRRMRSLGGAGCPAHPEADVCTDPAQGQAYATPEELRQRWGPLGYLYYWPRIQEAVEATRGLILTYAGQPIDAVYHSTSGGRTEDAVAVWGRWVPYLVSVPSPYEERSPRLEQTVELSLDELAARLGLDPARVRAAARAGRLVEGVEASLSGRVLRLRVAGAEMTGAEVRQKLGLNSTLFRWEVRGDKVTFRVRGFGHGVGLSQYGANGLARRGADFRAILQHYYPGAELRRLP